MSNLPDHAADIDAKSASSVPHPSVTGIEIPADGFGFLTITMQSAKPIPGDLGIIGESTTDLGMSLWMLTGLIGTNNDQDDHIDRTFTTPMMIGTHSPASCE